MSTKPRIVVPVGLPAGTGVSLPAVEQQARAFDAEVILLHVLEGRDIVRDGSVSPAEAKARAHLDGLAVRLRSGGVPAQPLVRGGPAVSTVSQTASEQGASLIIVTKPIRRGLRCLLPGGNVQQIAQQAPCPVLLVGPVEPAAGSPTELALRAFDEDAAHIGPMAPQFLGTRTVDVSRIVGTVSRAPGLAEDFRSRKPNAEAEVRFIQVLRAMERSPEQLPPVSLHKLGYGYYSLNGHAQVAAARQLQQSWIEAEVTEYVPVGDVEAQQVAAERAAFERMTGLTQVGASRSSTYARLEGFIDAFACAERLSDRQEAATRWYVAVFRPLQHRLRRARLGHYFPGERSADILVRIADRAELLARLERRAVTAEEALEHLLARARALAAT